MKLHIVKFEPSSKTGEHTIDVPAGGQVVCARMTRMGDGEVVVAAPEEAVKTEPCQLLFLWEDMRNVGGGDQAQWRHIGSWNFSSGSWQHCFVRVAVPEAPKKRAAANASTVG